MNEIVTRLGVMKRQEVLGTAVALAAVVCLFMATGRVTVRHSLLFLDCTVLLDVVAAVFSVRLQAAVSHGLHQVAVLGLGVVLIGLSGVFLFRELRQGGGFPERLEPRRTAQKAHTAVIQEAYVQGISSRSVDDCCWMRPSYSMRCLQRCRAAKRTVGIRPHRGYGLSAC